ncbi:Catalase family protein [Stigmatella aurantiaca DW4/3-1]|uniref:catalase n=2 Tax=Stigmatella aurantiaca TaxID=41 RepID=Q08W75_STIAD|nr:Catalase family protein [Stigmatella aurantiaca DW4/3-1]EAU64737.1 catalase [Stigmatella aurantiaca DW4/3-1]
MDGFGSHTFQWVNAQGERFWVKFHFKTDQGIRTLTTQEAEAIGGKDPQHHQRDLYRAIERGEFPSWTLKVQVMPEADAAHYRFNPFDLTKVWPHKDYLLVEVGKLVLNRTPDNFFADVEKGGARNYGRDGAMHFDGNGGRGPNHEPNSLNGPAQTDEASGVGYAVSGVTGTSVHGKHVEDNEGIRC